MENGNGKPTYSRCGSHERSMWRPFVICMYIVLPVPVDDFIAQLCRQKTHYMQWSVEFFVVGSSNVVIFFFFVHRVQQLCSYGQTILHSYMINHRNAAIEFTFILQHVKQFQGLCSVYCMMFGRVTCPCTCMCTFCAAISHHVLGK